MERYEYDLSLYSEKIDKSISKHNIKIRHVFAEATDPSFSFPERNTIIINDAYETHISPLFIMAHEVFHTIGKNANQQIYAFSPLAKLDEEKNAHLFALNLFFDAIEDSYTPNYIEVMHALGLPLSMEHLVRQVWFDHFSVNFVI
ncbi:hypothetical protein [Leuconostoc lactis]|jgi:Zn-dependent peptidase ImmA (M78 family)|uniref:hypothetical protein n=1 Tax=Leuconostoc lactis TaxID=1246 RepID=UPI00241D172D|nr:hypothetical protein [Leuconostoc lactis]